MRGRTVENEIDGTHLARKAVATIDPLIVTLATDGLYLEDETDYIGTVW